MLKNNKLLYIFPEMAFTAKVAETPKEDYYFVQAFHQINGDFMKDENFLFENLKKLLERIDAGTYTMVLPDFIFTDTIVNVPETEDIKIAEHLRDQLLPRIEVSTFSHDTRTSVLLQRKNNAKVQLSALEKELIATIKLAIGNKDITIDEIVPLSWTLKATVSLEPSLTIAQVGERLYLAEHYIGINQTINAKLTDLEIIAETVKTLKGADPNLQTTYLLTSGLVEERLKKLLLKTLPVQQLTEENEADAKVPSYLRQIIEVGARTLSLTDFPVPRFNLIIEEAPPITTTVTPEIKTEIITTTESLETQEEEEEKAITQERTQKDGDDLSSINTPTSIDEAETLLTETVISEQTEAKILAPSEQEMKKTDSSEVSQAPTEISSDIENQVTPTTPTPATAIFLPKKNIKNENPIMAISQASKEDENLDSITNEKNKESKTFSTNKQEKTSPITEMSNLDKIETKAIAISPKTEVEAKNTPMVNDQSTTPEKIAKKKLTLSFMSQKISEKENKKDEATILNKNEAKNEQKDDKITNNLETKKKGRMGMFFKKLFLFIFIFVITIVIGIGVGLGVLKLSGKDIWKSDATPTPEPTFLPTPEPIATPIVVATESAQPATTSADIEKNESKKEPEIAIAKQKILVVNATGVAGLAGKIKTALEKEGFVSVQTGNAKGEYEDKGTFVLMKERQSALIKILEKASGKTLIYDEDYQTEDASGTYDAVIVLNEA